MSPFYDQQGEQLADAQGPDPANNTAGYTVEQMYPGLLNSPPVGILGCNPCTSSGVTRKAERTANADNRQAQIDSGWGASPHQGPLGWASAITGFADRIPQFFRPNGNEYTNSLVEARRPMKGQPAKAVTPQDTYDKFYQRLRDFARAEEVSDKGAVQIRSR